MGVDVLNPHQVCGLESHTETRHTAMTDNRSTDNLQLSHDSSENKIRSLQDELKECYTRIAELEEAVNKAEARELKLLQSLTDSGSHGGSFAGSPNKSMPNGPRKQLSYHDGNNQRNKSRLGSKTKSTPVVYSPLNPTNQDQSPPQDNDIVVHIIREHCDAAFGFTLGGSDINIGLRVAAVSEGGPADVAGLSVNDIVLSIDGVDFRRRDITTLEAANVIAKSGTLLTVNLLDPEVRNNPEKYAATLAALESGQRGSGFPMAAEREGQQFPMKIKASFMGTTVQAPDLWTFFLGWRRWRRKQERRVTAQYHVTREVSDEDFMSDSTGRTSSGTANSDQTLHDGAADNSGSTVGNPVTRTHNEEEQCVIKHSLDRKSIHNVNPIVSRAPGKMHFGGFGSKRRKQASELQAVYQAAQSTLHAERTKIETSTSAFDFSDLSTMMGDASDDEDATGAVRRTHPRPGSSGIADDDFDADATCLYNDDGAIASMGSPARRLPSDSDFSALYNDCLYGDDTAVAWAEFKAIFGADDDNAVDVDGLAAEPVLCATPNVPQHPNRSPSYSDEDVGEGSDFVITPLPPRGVSREASHTEGTAGEQSVDVGLGAAVAPANMRGIMDISAPSEHSAQHAAARKRATLSRTSGKGVVARSVAAARRQGGTGLLPGPATSDPGRTVSTSSTDSSGGNDDDAAAASTSAPRDRRVQLSAKGLFAQKLAHVRAAGQKGSEES
eukprot:m.330246 g.330246  ORF g.330246 m.330246 type:complete len:726 (+) comp20459_c0_seq1:382-2559(+)